MTLHHVERTGSPVLGRYLPPPMAFRARQDRAPRAMTALLVGRIIGERSDALCRIRNISDGGLRAEVHARFDMGEQIRIEFRNGDAVTGEVRWADGNAIGVQFDTPINAARLLAASKTRPGTRGATPRAPRLPTRSWAEIRAGGHVRRASLVDLSQGGAKLHMRGTLERDAIVTVAMPGLDPARGVVRWVREEHVGIAFLEPIAFVTLAHWLNDPGSRYAAAAGHG